MVLHQSLMTFNMFIIYMNCLVVLLVGDQVTTVLEIPTAVLLLLFLWLITWKKRRGHHKLASLQIIFFNDLCSWQGLTVCWKKSSIESGSHYVVIMAKLGVIKIPIILRQDPEPKNEKIPKKVFHKWLHKWRDQEYSVSAPYWFDLHKFIRIASFLIWNWILLYQPDKFNITK